MIAPYVDLGYDVALLDYRGYGKSSGERTEPNLYADAQSVYDHFKTTISEEKLIIFGRSLGTAMAIHLAANNDPSKLILVTPFYSLQALAQKIAPIYPTRLLLRFPFKSYKFIQNVKCPIYFFQGTADDVVPYEESKKLFNLVEGSRGTFYTIEGGEHNNLVEFDKFRTAMKAALDN